MPLRLTLQILTLHQNVGRRPIGTPGYSNLHAWDSAYACL